MQDSQDFLTSDSGLPVVLLQQKLTALGGFVAHHESSRTLIHVRRHAMSSYAQDRKVKLEKVDALCMELFDFWCESRSVTPLSYLMHSWPMLESSTMAIRRLNETLTDLRSYHMDWLNAQVLATLGELCESLGELAGYVEVEQSLARTQRQCTERRQALAATRVGSFG